MPIMTTLRRRQPEEGDEGGEALEPFEPDGEGLLLLCSTASAKSACSRISAALRLRSLPIVPVAQNVQPMAHPTWLLTQSVARLPPDSRLLRAPAAAAARAPPPPLF